MQAHIHSLYVYPIKSCQGIRVETAELVDTGFKYDRHWMLIDKQGRFLSQRQCADMARIKTHLGPETLSVSSDECNFLSIPIDSDNGKRTTVQIWSDTCEAAGVSAQVSEWFSDFLHTECDLVFLPHEIKRSIDKDYAQPGQSVGFADGFPLLILSLASIDMLNNQLQEKVDVDRFRANIVIDGCEAHAEDQWTQISVNDIDINLVKACSRCVIPSIHQQTAQKHPDLLKTLASYRRQDGKVYVGQNAIHQTNGNISVGQTITIR